MINYIRLMLNMTVAIAIFTVVYNSQAIGSDVDIIIKSVFEAVKNKDMDAYAKYDIDLIKKIEDVEKTAFASEKQVIIKEIKSEWKVAFMDGYEGRLQQTDYGYRPFLTLIHAVYQIRSVFPQNAILALIERKGQKRLFKIIYTDEKPFIAVCEPGSPDWVYLSTDQDVLKEFEKGDTFCRNAKIKQLKELYFTAIPHKYEHLRLEWKIYKVISVDGQEYRWERACCQIK